MALRRPHVVPTLVWAADGHARAMPEDAEFRVAVMHERGGVHVRPIGEVDLGTIGELRARMDEAMAAVGDRLILDLRATTFFDSSGLHLVLDIEAWAARRGTEFAIIAGPSTVQHTFDAAGLSGRLPFVDGPDLRSSGLPFVDGPDLRPSATRSRPAGNRGGREQPV